MPCSQKVWGVKDEIYRNDLCEVDLLHLLPYSRCSWHHHITKANLFVCVSGTVFIRVEELGVKHDVELREGVSFTVYPGQKHEFYTKHDPATVIEIMSVQYDAEDIVRENEGGRMKKHDVEPETLR